MIATHCPDRETLFAYSVGRLDDQRSDDVANHLSSCPDCQAEIQTLDDHSDTLMSRLRTPADDPCLEEPQLGAAVAEALARAGRSGASQGGSSLSGKSLLLGEYQLLDELGRGGMGRVYLALHTKLDRVVTLKILPKSRLEDPQAMARFEREMKAIGRLNHPNIVHATDAREIDGQPVLIMEYIDGLDLAELVRRLGRLPVADACELVRQAAAGLQYAHEHGLVHRDVKPSNLMLSRDGEVKLLDLGLARLYAGGLSRFSRPEDLLSPTGPSAVKVGLSPSEAVGAREEMTDTGQAMGTADYMAPEQANDSRSVDIRADLYSLGCTLYKLLAGRAPFGGPEHRGTFDKMTAQVREPIPLIRQFAPEVPEGVCAILDRLLAKEPEGRYAEPAEVAEALVPFCSGANLVGVVDRAAAASRLAVQNGPATRGGEIVAGGAAHPEARRHRIVRRLAISLALLALVSAAFAAGVLITIKRNGETYRLMVPPGSRTTVDENGNPIVELSGTQEERPSSLGTSETSAPAVAAGQMPPGAKSLREAIRVFNARAAEDPVGHEQRPMTEDEVIAAIRWALLKPGELPVSDATLETLKKIVDSRALPPEFEFEVLTKFEPTDRMEFTKWSVRLRIPAEPQGTTCISIREVPISSRLFGPQERKVIEKWREKWSQQGGIASFDRPEYAKEREEAARADCVGQEPFGKPGDATPKPSGTQTEGAAAPPKPTSGVDATASLRALKGPWKVVHVDKGKDADSAWGRILGYDPGSENPATVQRLYVWEGFLEFGSFENAVAWLFDYRVDPTATPKNIDFLQQQGGVQTGPLLAVGIYEVDGDRLRLCLRRYLPSLLAEQRPTGFTAEPNSGDILFTLERYRPSTDEKAIGGTQQWPVDWTVLSQTEDGKPVSQETLRTRRCHFARWQFSMYDTDPRGVATGGTNGLFLVDAAKQPTEITIYVSTVDGKHGRQGLLGIYKLDGDRLMIAYHRGDPRPTKFESNPGSGVTLLVLKKGEPPKATSRIGFGRMDSTGMPLHTPTQTERSGEPAGQAAERSALAPAVDPAAELKTLQGPWEVLHVEKGANADFPLAGHAWGEFTIAAVNRIDFTDRYLHLEALGQGFTVMLDYSIDPEAVPKTIDVRGPSAPDSPGELVARGVYELDGDRLRICLVRHWPALKPQQRPAGFAVAPNSADVLFTLKRYRPTADEKAIQGKWMVTEQMDDGKPVAQEMLRRQSLIFSRNHALRNGPSDMGSGILYQCVLDPTKQPKTMTLIGATQVPSSFEIEKQELLGIYKLEDDRLTIAWRAGGPRPTTFESKPGSGVTLLVLTRKKWDTGSKPAGE